MSGGGRRVSLPPPRSRSYAFDCVFPPESSQEEVYACTSPLLRAALDGFNAALLAYGQTGAGKTYTLGFEGCPFPGAPLQGCPPKESDGEDRKGILPRACEDVFRLIQDRRDIHAAQGEKLDVQVTCSFLELYNEEIRDLLSDSQLLRSLTIRHDAVSGQVTVQDLRSVPCSSPKDLLACLHQGSRKRITGSSAYLRFCTFSTSGATAQNSASSRSHAIFSIFLKQQVRCSSSSCGASCVEGALNPSGSQAASAASSRVVFSLLQFADLAGSERGKKSGTGGKRQAEGIAINSGLLALAKVIRALTRQQKRKMHHHQQQQQHQPPQQQKQRRQHVPYRDSKLTRLLEPVLGGNSKALMIACVSPAAKDLHETVQTLDYAARARLIQNNPSINTKPTGDLIASLREEIFKLKLLLSAKESSDTAGSPDAWKQGETSSDRHQQQPEQQNSISLQPPCRASAEEEESEDNRLRQELNRLAEEGAGLRRQVEVLEGQLQQQEGQHQRQEKGPQHVCRMLILSSARCHDTAESSSVIFSRQPPPAASSDQGEESHKLLQLQRERLLLLREQQLLQREQQLRQEMLLHEQQQLQRNSKAHSDRQGDEYVSRYPQQNPQSPALEGVEQHVQTLQLQEECQLMQQRQTASSCSEFAEVDKSVGEAMHVNGNKATTRKRSTGHLLGSDSKPISNPEPLLMREEGRMAGPPKKKEKRGRRPAVFFSVVECAHEGPVKKASFLHSDISVAKENACLETALLLTASDSSLKMWDLQRMTARWRYTAPPRHSSPSAEPLVSFWGLTPALKRSLVIAGLGNYVLTFDVRGPVSNMCCLLFDASKCAFSSSPPHSRLVVSSPVEGVRVFDRWSWISLGGPRCSSLATLPDSCIVLPWEPRTRMRRPQGGSVLAALDEKGETLRTWNLPTTVCGDAGPRDDMPSCSKPLTASFEARATTTTTTTGPGNAGKAARLTSLTAWKSRRCFATANE
ncbi:hypothetical protein ACSSS7_004028 [Eimeria intestinalis]